MKSQNILPFRMNENLESNLYNTFFRGILWTYKNLEGWIMEHNIQLYFKIKKNICNSNEIININNKEKWDEARELFTVQYLNSYKIDTEKIIEIVKKKINNGYYCCLSINDKLEVNNLKDIVIVGWNDIEKIFVVGEYSESSYNLKKYSYNIFKYYFAYQTNDIKLYKPRFSANIIYSVNLKNMLIKSIEYMESVNKHFICDKRVPFNYLNNDENIIYGIKIYEYLKYGIRECLFNKNNLNYSIFNVLYEHKIMMQKRLKYIMKIYNIDIYFLYIDNEKLIIISSILKDLVLKYNKKKSNKKLLEIENKIDELYKRDNIFMCNFISLLSKLLKLKD